MTPDVLPKLLIEIREDADVAAITTRIRGFEPAPGDAGGAGAYRAFVVLVQLDASRLHPGVPVQRPVIVARCYGRTHQEAAALRWAVGKAIHHRGVRVHANGLGIYQSTEETGGAQEKDPDTGQPLQTLTITSLATTQAVA